MQLGHQLSLFDAVSAAKEADIDPFAYEPAKLSVSGEFTPDADGPK